MLLVARNRSLNLKCLLQLDKEQTLDSCNETLLETNFRIKTHYEVIKKPASSDAGFAVISVILSLKEKLGVINGTSPGIECQKTAQGEGY